MSLIIVSMLLFVFVMAQRSCALVLARTRPWVFYIYFEAKVQMFEVKRVFINDGVQK